MSGRKQYKIGMRQPPMFLSPLAKIKIIHDHASRRLARSTPVTGRGGMQLRLYKNGKPVIPTHPYFTRAVHYI